MTKITNHFSKNVLLLFFCILLQSGISAQDRDISYMTSGGKLHPLQANMDIRHYTLVIVGMPRRLTATINGMSMVAPFGMQGRILNLT